MAVEKYYKDSNGEYIKVIQKSENLDAKEEANLRNQLQGKKPSIREQVVSQKTTAGRNIYIDPKTGDNFSEKSTTFQTDSGQWITIPTVNTRGGKFDISFLEDFVRRNGAKDPLTGRDIPLFDSEQEAVEYAKERSNSLIPQRKISQKLYDSRGRFRGADYKTGVNADLFRIEFSETNNFKEKVNFLDQKVGKNGYVVDRMGNFLLTQEGRGKVGQEGSNLLAIDAERFEAEDFSDFYGELGDVIGFSVAGEVGADIAFRKTVTSKSPMARLFRKGHFGKANKLAKILGKTAGIIRPATRIAANAAGAAGGAYVGNVFSEAQQIGRKVSDESWKDIQARGITEAKIAGGFAVLGNLAAKGIGTVIKTKGAKKFTQEVYGEQAYKNWEETGILKADENSVMDRISRGYLVDLFNEIDSPIRGRIMAAMDTIAKGNLKRDKVNVEAVLKELKEQFPFELENFTDEQLIETLKMYLNGEGKLLKKALKAHKAQVGAAAADGLSALLRLSQKGEIPINDIADMYDVVNQAVALSSVEAMKTAEILGRKGLQNVDELFVGVDGAIDRVAASIGGPRMKNVRGSSNEATNNTINYLQGLKGNPNVEDLRFLIDDNGEILLVTSGGSQNFVGTQSISQELAKVKGAFKDVIIEEGGPLAKIWDNINPEGQILKPLYISATESNLLIQQMRKISLDGVQGSKFDTRKLWDAAILDNDIATAALDNAINQGKAGKIRARSGADKNLINKGLAQMDEYNAAVKDITIDSRNQMQIFEEYGLGELAIRVADGEVNYNNLIDVLLDPNRPENLESFMKFFTETIKKQRKSIYRPSKQMPDEYIDIALDDAGQPIKTVTGPQKTAYDAIKSGKMDSEISQVVFKPGSRPAEKLAQEGKINFVNSNMSIDEIENFVRDELKRATLRRMVNDEGRLSLTNIQRVIEELGVKDIGKPGAKSSLETIFGKETSEELLNFADSLDNVVAGIDVPEEIAGRLQKGLAQVNRVVNDANPNPKALDDALEEFSEAQDALNRWNKSTFQQRLRNNNYILKNSSDFNLFVDDLFGTGEGPVVITKDIEKIVNRMAPEELEQLQSRVMDKFLGKLGFDDLAGEGITLQNIVTLFEKGNVRRVLGEMEPQRFNIIFKGTGGKGSFKGKNPFETLRVIVGAAKKSTVKHGAGSIVAAAFAMAIAGAPLGILMGGLTLTAAGTGAMFGLIGTGIAIKLLSKMMLDPDFMRMLATSSLPQRTMTKGQWQRQISGKTLRNLSVNMTRSREGDKKRMGPSAADIRKIRNPKGLREKTANLGARAADVTAEIATAVPRIGNNLVNLLTPGSRNLTSRYKTPTKLPNVRTFDDTIFSETERRRALAGNNPNTQALVGRK